MLADCSHLGTCSFAQTCLEPRACNYQQKLFMIHVLANPCSCTQKTCSHHLSVSGMVNETRVYFELSVT